MNVKEYIKKNKVFSFFSICFIIWITILVLLSITANRQVFFYDWLEEEKVNWKYKSEVPILRYFIEPIVGLALMLGGYDYISGFIMTIIIYRIVYFHLKKNGYLESEKAKLIWHPIKDLIRFSFILISVSVIAGFIAAGIIYATIGFFYLNLYFMAMLQIIMFSALAVIICYGIIILIKYFHPKLKLNYGSKKRYNLPASRNRRQKGFRIFRREFVYTFGIALLLAGISMVLLTIQFPMHNIESDLDDDEVLLDFHVHTHYSDGWLSPAERVNWYIEHGIDGAAFSDHDNLRGSIEAKQYVKDNNLDFTVFFSEEWTDHENGIHMNIFGLDETIVPLESENDAGVRAMNAEDTIKYVKKKGGYITVNHYNYNENPDGGYGTPYSLEDLMDWGVDGFEIVNGGNFKHPKIKEFCKNNSLACMAATDMHTNDALDTFVRLKVNDSDDLTIDDVFYNLKRNKHEAVAIDTNPKNVNLHAMFSALEMDFVEDFVEYLLNLNSLQVVSWIAWSTGFYAFFYLIYTKAKKLDIEKLKRNIL